MNEELAVESEEAFETHKCPECGSELFLGYGLAGGGSGAYVACGTCDYFSKEEDNQP